MEKPWQVFLTPDSLKKSLAIKLGQKAEIFSHREEPLLAALIACMGVQFEMGNPKWDRLSAPLGIDLSKYQNNPWKTEIISFENNIGIRMWIEGVDEFYPEHADFREILHPLSLDENGKLSQIIIFPSWVAENYQKRGLELVIVRDWALSSFLSFDEVKMVNYFYTNEWEIKTNIGFTQIKLMTKQRLAFFGTHDIADHLLGGRGTGLLQNDELYQRVEKSYELLFPPRRTPKNISLLVSYLIGVLLDDLAQPLWYSCENHRMILVKSLKFLEEVETLQWDLRHLEMPESFHGLIKLLRERQNSRAVGEQFDRFSACIVERNIA